MKYKPRRDYIKSREKPPLVRQTKKGVAVECPFCVPTHAILPGVESPCGTTLRVTAVQAYLSSHYTKFNKIRCLKCGNFGGEMIRYRAGYVHMEECSPETKLITEIPKFSALAKIVHKLPEKLRTTIEKRTGFSKQLQEIDPEGKPTGRILGYFFWKKG